MSRNIRVLRFGQAREFWQGTLLGNFKGRTLAVKTTTTRALLAFILICSGQSAWSYTVSGTTYSTNGSQSDVQAACNAAPDNGTVTVLIPNGTYSWTGTLAITKSLNLAGASATGVIIKNNLASGDMIDATSSANGNINIYWLNLQQIANNGFGTGAILGADRTEPSNYTVLIHDCSFNAGTIGSYSIICRANGIIIWNDDFPNITGIYFTCGKYGPTSSWNTPDSYGSEDTTGVANSYVENCTFEAGSQYLLNIDDNSRVVFRNNVTQDCSVGSHGQESSPYGCREWEIYNNTFHVTTGNPYNLQCWFMDRGGAGVFWGNAMDLIQFKSGIQFCVFSVNSSQQIPLQTSWPAARQVGQGWSASSSSSYGNPVVAGDGKGQVTAGIYIWNNTGTAAQDPGFLSIDGSYAVPYVQAGRDYFTTAKPGYTPYTYPHPLHSKFAVGGSSPTPTPNATPLAPQNLKVN